jgi:DNA-binding NarL/FixJ family response regulator
MTREFFRELAADSRKCLESRTLTAFQRDRFALDAEIFERMASQLEPFEALETELWARDRDIMVLHGRAASCNRINYRTGRAIMTVENHADAVREKLGLEKPKVEASAPALPDDMNNLMRKTGFSPASSL